MATLSLSDLQSYVGGVAGGSSLFGYDGSNRVVRYTFKTGSEGASKVTLSGSITKSWGMYDVSSENPIRFKITTSSTSHTNAGAGSSYDGQITSTTVNVSVNVQLKPNTTYYLWLFPGSTATYLYYSYNNSGDPTLSIVTALSSYKLTINAGTGVSISVNRTSSVQTGASTGILASGATIYHGDVLKITFTAADGYEIETHTVNGIAFTSGNTHTVVSAVTVKATASQMGVIYICIGTTVEAFLIFIDNGTSWDQFIPNIDNGSDWDLCS